MTRTIKIQNLNRELDWDFKKRKPDANANVHCSVHGTLKPPITKNKDTQAQQTPKVRILHTAHSHSARISHIHTAGTM